MKQFTVLLGPINSNQVGGVIDAIGSYPLIEIKVIDTIINPHGNGQSKTGIVRHTVTKADVSKMLTLRAAGYDAKTIAPQIPCAAITVRRHAPRNPNGKLI